MKEVFAILEAHNLSRTPCRMEMIKVLQEANSAVSEQLIKEKLGNSFDRTTIYRTLKSFSSQDVIHSITLEGGEVRYALTPLKQRRINHDHIHFHCSGCNNVFCIPEPKIQMPELPSGFLAKNFDLLIEGLCKTCNT